MGESSDTRETSLGSDFYAVKSTTSATPQIGDLDDGGIYVGLSAENGKPLHAALADERERLTLGEAFEAAIEMRKLPGRENAHVPTPKELDKNLFDNRNTGHLKDTFNTSGSYPGSVYRSSASCYYDFARTEWFVDGRQGYDYRDDRLPVRLVW